MKKLLIVLMLLPGLAIAQSKTNAKKNICRKISKTVDRKRKITTFKSPPLKHITAIREYKEDQFFGLHLHMEHDHELINAQGITIDFSDGSSLKEESASIKCRQQPVVLDNRYMGSGTQKYELNAFFHITPENYEKFISKRITKVYLLDASFLVPEKDATKLKAYIECLADKMP